MMETTTSKTGTRDVDDQTQVSFDHVRKLVNALKINSPALLLSRRQVRENLKQLALALPRAQIHYAVKSNNHPAILSEVAASGHNFDVCSSGEIDDALTAGAKAQDLIHSHPVKSMEEFEAAVKRGVEIFVVDNPDEIEKLVYYTEKKLKILVRYRVNVKQQAIVNLQYKYGCTVDEVLPLARLIEEKGHRYYGLTFHIGSQCIHTQNYLRALEAARELIRQLDIEKFSTEMLDIGGGFPVRYCESVPSIEELCQPINLALHNNIRPGIKIVCEPGRFISASTVTLVTSIVGRARRDSAWWYYLNDGIYSTFSGMVFDSCKYPVLTSGDGENSLSVLAGPTCDSFDVMYDGIMIPEQKRGDLVVFPMTGAYCSVSGSRFNSLKQPEYVVVD